MILILILFLVLILVLLTFSRSLFNGVSIEKQLYNGDKWANYRLGDVYMLNKNEDMYNPTVNDNILYHKDDYVGTIANEYINKNKLSGKNEKLLKQIIESKAKDKYTYPDTLFLHIRIGDVLCEKNKWLTKINGPKHYSKVGDTTWWNNILDYIKSNGINNVVIISGSHKNKCLKESADFIEDRKKFFNDNGIKVSYRLGQSPDEDLIMCYYVKHFITTGGGYGNMIKEIKMK